MLTRPRFFLSYVAMVLCVFLACSTTASAHEHKSPKGKVTVEDSWARATFAMAKTGAVYFELANASKRDVRLLEVKVDSSVASDAQLHETLMDGEMMQMRQAEEGFSIPSGENLSLQPGGKHVMLLGLKKPLNVGDTFVLSLVFERNVIMRVPITVKDGR